MVELTKLNGTVLVVNSDLIEFVEVLPDSLITLTTGTKIMVRENVSDIIMGVVEFRKRIRRESDSQYRRPDVASEEKK
ncbi:flagellar protein FlbD [candidate division LCP-89 bacterium B3_LCP]|uniref:Flagellar protein FlbD n=1 Tax=candidate division LCP-89 bacterium B3_LCP TaxID=2012998 RepID=A0A532V4V9_UNCL8|nr:MAG: flagellar protein FlbD [candidate division LCP-89 bacterium B3_LCP]